MRLTPRLIEILQRLIEGEAVAFSSLSKSLSGLLVSEGLLTITYHGTRRLLRAPNPDALKMALPRFNEALCNLDIAGEIADGHGSRALQAGASGNSKTRATRSCPRFLVNTYEDVECQFNGQSISINPPMGSATYIADWKTFIPSASILIVGVENMENFLMIRKQRKLIESFMRAEETGVLFVARYAFSSDLTEWLRMIPNRYLHFGDFDLAGISIFLSQFKPVVGDRGSFLIPDDIETHISHGSRQRYDEQYARYSGLTTDDPELIHLIGIIHNHRRAYDQEGYIYSSGMQIYKHQV